MVKLSVYIIALVWGLQASPKAFAQQEEEENVAEFYRNKRLTFITGYTAGGSFDLITRLTARHLAKYVPGQPSSLVQNMRRLFLTY